MFICVFCIVVSTVSLLLLLLFVCSLRHSNSELGARVAYIVNITHKTKVMMSRISGNQTTNSEQPNASVSGVSTTATDLASAAATFNKQRKKRKKKKDKILLTNRAVNCSCGKRIESSCNSISTCSNCVPTACVYCHFNDLAYRENYPTRHPDNTFHCNIKTEPSINFWSQNIAANDINDDDDNIENDNNENNSSDQCCNIEQNTHNNGNYFMRHQRNIGLNRRTEQLQRFAVYENLCEFCGFAIGNGAYHLHCDASKQHIHIDDEQQQQPKPENIYENICESCHSIFDGEQCISETCKRNPNDERLIESIPVSGEVINVLVKKPPIANRQFGKQFSEFLGSFRQKLTSKSGESDRKKPKIEIVHNVDGVFKTNQTFDLKEIVQLKNQSVCGISTEYNHTSNACRELRNSIDDIAVTELPSKPIQVFRASTSDSNFLEKFHSTPPYLQTPYSESIVSDTILYSNSYAPPSYEDAICNKYASVTPFKLRGRIKPNIHESTSASSFFTYNSSASTLQTHSFATNRKSPLVSSVLECNDDSALKQWLESIKRQTHDYVNDNRQFECGSIKCLPSKMLNENATPLKWSIEHGDSMNGTEAVASTIEAEATHRVNHMQTTNLRRRIELFKENLLEHRMHSKRNAIYIKDSICDVTFDATMQLPDTITPDIETSTVSTALVPFSRHPNDNSDSAENSVDNVCLRSKNQQLTPFTVDSSSVDLLSPEQHINHNVALEATSQYLQMLKAFYMEQVTLSTGLNRIILVCGDRHLHFYVKYLMSQSKTSLEHSSTKLVSPTRYTNIQQIIEIIHKLSVTKQLGENDKGAKIKQKRFLMRLTNSPSRIPLRSRHKRTIDDFTKRIIQRNACYLNVQQVKTLDDFSKPNTKDFDTATKSLNDFARKNYSSTTDTTDVITNPAVQPNHESHPKDESVKNNDENIYQPIWEFKTVGQAPVDTDYENDSLNNFNTCANEYDDTMSHDEHEWEVAQEEFLFSSQRIDDIPYSNDTRQMSHTGNCSVQLSEVSAKHEQKMSDKSPYQTICVLYNTVEPKWNEIIYDYNGNSRSGENKENKAENRTPEGTEYDRNIKETRPNEVIERNKQLNQLCNGQEMPIKLDSINAWKTMLRAVDYIEDEEDVILSESYLLNQKSAEYNNQNNDNLQSAQSHESVSDTTKSSIASDKTEETDLSSDLSVNSSATSISPIAPTESKTKKESGFLNKLQYRRFDISKNNAKKDDVVQGLFYKNLNGKTHSEPSPPMEIKRLNQSGSSNIVFGTTLEDVEKDECHRDIPKFVVECIKVIEIEENLHTNGIYRASGKKDSIDKLRKRMNESKLRKGTKYVSLKDEDVHTVTGALKQFFRELKSELIPDDIVKNLPNDLENESSIASIRNGLSTIDYLSRETLKYLLQHLIRVDANREHNLMNASNLSIVWGASLFTSSVSITNAFETSDLLRRNTLIKVLIQRYDDIFIDTDRLI